MIVFLDASLVIYFVQQPPAWGPKAAARLAALKASGDRPAVSDLVRMECRVGPLKAGDATLLSDFSAFFTAGNIQVFPVTAAVCDRASAIRARTASNRLTPSIWPRRSKTGVDFS